MRSKLFLQPLIGLFLFTFLASLASGEESGKEIPEMKKAGEKRTDTPARASNPITIFMTGDVMTGRGIDQVLPHPGNPQIFEPYVRDARTYIKLAERVNGPIR